MSQASGAEVLLDAAEQVAGQNQHQQPQTLLRHRLHRGRTLRSHKLHTPKVPHRRRALENDGSSSYVHALIRLGAGVVSSGSRDPPILAVFGAAVRGPRRSDPAQTPATRTI